MQAVSGKKIYAYASSTGLKRAVRRRVAAGFTLLELMIALGVVGLMIGLVVPSFSSSSRRIEMRAIMLEVDRRIINLRNEAYRSGLILGLESDVRPDVYVGENSITPLAYRRYMELDEGWSFVSGETIVFFPSGYCGGGSGRIENNEKNLRRDVVFTNPKCRRTS